MGTLGKTVSVVNGPDEHFVLCRPCRTRKAGMEDTRPTHLHHLFLPLLKLQTQSLCLPLVEGLLTRQSTHVRSVTQSSLLFRFTLYRTHYSEQKDAIKV